MRASPFRTVSGGVRVSVRVVPKSATDGIRGIELQGDGSACVKVAVTAAPEHGRANAAVLKLLARTWKLPKTSLSMASGATSRRKVVLVSGDPDVLIAQLKEWGNSLP